MRVASDLLRVSSERISNNSHVTEPDWTRLEALFHDARAIDASAREEFVVSATKGDAALEQALRGLLAADTAGGAFMESPVARLAGMHEPPDRLGPYHIVRLIGRGGTGDVYLARRDDEHYTMDVAIKVIRGSHMADVAARFRQERQILAGLEHPSIARLVDGGAAPDGTPYLVMEYVDGVPITEFADTHTLDASARVALVLRVLDALAYAHRHLVVHRDIKPGNILVTPANEPKLLDFGLAKLLTSDEVLVTATAGRMMTLEYASPEQVSGRAVTTASDIYSTGVLLFRLLSGRSPYRSSADALAEITRAICVDEPLRLSAAAEETGRPRLSGDLEAIVHKALRKEPERRYQSADELADDLRRWQDGRPVLARQGTWTYRSGRFLSRHRVGVAVAALVVAAAVAGVWRIAQERRKAERRFNDVRALAHSVVFDYHDAITKLPGSVPVRERLVKDALKYLDSLSADAAGDRSLERELASAYEKIGEIQGDSYYPNLGETQQAIGNLQKSVDLREVIWRESPTDASVASELARSHDRLGDVLWQRNDLKGALAHFTRGAEVMDAVHAADSSSLDTRLDLAAALEKMGDVYGNAGFANLGDPKTALTHYRRALAIRESGERLAPKSHDVQSALFGSHHRLAGALRLTGDSAGAITHIMQALDIQQRLYLAEPTASQHRVLGIAFSRTADELDQAGRFAEARDYTLKAMGVFRELFEKDRGNSRAERELAVMTRKVARLSVKAGDGVTALAKYQDAHALTSALAAKDAGNVELQRDLAMGEDGIADALALLNRLPESATRHRRAAAISKRILASAPENVQAASDLATAQASLAGVLKKMGQHREAISALREAVQQWQALDRRGILTSAQRKRYDDVRAQLAAAGETL